MEPSDEIGDRYNFKPLKFDEPKNEFVFKRQPSFDQDNEWNLKPSFAEDPDDRGFKQSPFPFDHMNI